MENTTTTTTETMTEISTIPASFCPIDTALVKTLAEHGSPLVALALVWLLFRSLTRFVQVCKEE
ncbi:MAG: hypothetical protein RH949_28260 [Coleofasciculus sp. A1-SPW-01]|uniref:hypothetical protein n=1 Tax=unclassified Coleofasciculus TaxID=2692782 RepID=UPI0032F40BB4